MRLALVLALACGGLGCGGGGGGGGNGTMDMAMGGGGAGGGGGGSGGCAFTLSGSYAASGTCTVTAVYNASSPSSPPGLGIEIAAGSTEFNFSSKLSSTNNFTDGQSYNQGNVVTAGAETLNGTAAWQIVIHNVNGMPDQGSFALTISSTGSAITATDGSMEWMSPHGTLAATMPADSGSTATGTVTAQVTF